MGSERGKGKGKGKERGGSEGKVEKGWDGKEWNGRKGGGGGHPRVKILAWLLLATFF